MEDNKVIQRSIGLPKFIWEKIQKDANKRYVSASVIIRDIVLPYYEEKEKEENGTK